MSLLKIFLVSIIAVLLIGCGETEKPKDVVNVPATKPVDETPKVPTPNFNADSAYNFIQNQLDFGYRIPNTPRT